MSKYEDLLIKYKDLPISDKYQLKGNFKGLYKNGVILIDKNLTDYQKHEVLAEEISHHYNSYGDITDQSKFNNRKFENYARRYAIENTISLRGLIKAFENNCHNLYEVANFFEVSECYVQQAIAHYKNKFGLSTYVGDYLIQFDPLQIFRYKDVG